jgi:Family of unknown function (DUF6445)
MIPITVIDNFYTDPYSVRNYALSQDFSRPVRIGWPGIRTKMIADINPLFYHSFVDKIMSLFFNLKTDIVQCNLDTYFQLTSKKYEEGWEHKDNKVSLAGVIYLTPGAPLSGGTSIFNEKVSGKRYDFTPRDDFYSGITNDVKHYRSLRKEHNLQFDKTLDVNNVFNRLVLYPGNYFHKENKFFGKTYTDSRLTQVFFIQIKTNGCLTAVERCNLAEIKGIV